MNETSAVEIIYRERMGCGNDLEGCAADGVEIQVTRFLPTGNHFNAPAHYLVQTWVVMDRQYSVSSMRATDDFVYEPSKQIRRAIAAFDALVRSHPAFGQGYEPEAEAQAPA